MSASWLIVGTELFSFTLIFGSGLYTNHFAPQPFRSVSPIPSVPQPFRTASRFHSVPLAKVIPYRNRCVPLIEFIMYDNRSIQNPTGLAELPMG